MKNIFYFDNINKIGGVEQFFYYLAKKHKNFVVYYKNADWDQLKRLTKLVECRKFIGQEIECDRAYFNYDLSIINRIKAKEYIEIIHADYKALGKKPNINSKITKYIGVSKIACESFKEITGLDCELMYNPVYPDTPEKTLLIVSATRLTQEKGKENIVKMGRKLNELGRPYLWLIFTNDLGGIKNPNIIYMSPKLNISSYIAKADFVAQLSKTESFGFTPNESLLLGTPVILTDLPIWKELGIENGKHGYIIDNFDTFDYNLLYQDLPKFKYNPPKDSWDIENESDYVYNEMVKIMPIMNIDDIETGVRHPKGVPFKVEKWRAQNMIDNGVAKEVK